MPNEFQIQQANNGDVEMQYKLGLFYCVNGKIQDARLWLEKAKQQNFNKAIITLKEINLIYGENEMEINEETKSGLSVTTREHNIKPTSDVYYYKYG